MPLKAVVAILASSPKAHRKTSKMAFQAQTSGGDLPKSEKLPVGQHHVVIKNFKVTTDTYQGNSFQKIIWTMESTDKYDDKGTPMIAFNSTRTAYGNEKAGLTIFLDAIFDGKLSKEIVAKMDLEGLADGSISGQIMILPHTTERGEKTTKFGAWIQSDYDYNPAAYFIAAPEVSASQAPSPKLPDTAPPRVAAPTRPASDPARPAAPPRQAPPRRPAPARPQAGNDTPIDPETGEELTDPFAE
jgi:hypothetical protein